MKVSHLVEELQKLPQDYSVELSKVISTPNDGKGPYQVQLDFPIIGLAQHDERKEINLVVAHDKTIAAFAKKIIPLE